jgi:uncharacterized protein (TIGR03000 family)
MLRRLTTLAALTVLAVICSLAPASSASADEQGWFYSRPNGYANTRSSSDSPRAYYYAPPISSYSLASPNSNASYYTPSDSLSDRAVRVSVHVPADAEIWFDGNPTQQRGERRTFVSPPLNPNAALRYEVRARWVDGSGRTVDQTRWVAVHAGQLSMVDFLSRESSELMPTSAEATNRLPSAANPKSAPANRP